MNKKNNIILGVVFIALGILFLLKNLDILNIYFNIFDIGFLIANFWPALFIILPGLVMHSSFFSGRHRDPGILVPGGILLTIGATFQISILTGLWHVMWPGFILSVAVGLFELYLFGTRDKALLIPVGILGGLSIMFFVSTSFRWLFGSHFKQLLVPGLLVLIGVSIMFRNSRGRSSF